MEFFLVIAMGFAWWVFVCIGVLCLVESKNNVVKAAGGVIFFLILITLPLVPEIYNFLMRFYSGIKL